jgi:hypothetical protein
MHPPAATRTALFALALAALTLALACSGDDDSDAQSASEPSATPEPVVTAEASPTPLPPGVCTRDGLVVPCPTPAPLPSQAWLVDVRDGSVTPIFEDPADDVIRYAGFDSGQAVLGIYDDEAEDFRLDLHRYELDGSLAGSAAWPTFAASNPITYWLPGDPICSPTEGGVEVDGDFFPEVDCGPISPDGRWMIYRVDRSPPDAGYDEITWDEWLVNLEAGEPAELQTGLKLCLGDSFFSPVWSPNGRYVFFGDCADGGRIFLGDTAEDTARVIVHDLPTYRNMPDWSRSRDLIVYLGGSGSTVLEDLDSGPPVDLGLPWPARFDTSGRYVYAAAPGDQGTEPETVIFDTETLVSTTLPGEALYRQWPVRQTSVAGTDNGYVAALSGQLYCSGMTIYVDGSPLGCIVDAAAPSFSPDGRYVALITGDKLTVVDVATGEQQVFLSGLRSDIPYPIPSSWSDDGSHILVRSPFEYGPVGP